MDYNKFIVKNYRGFIRLNNLHKITTTSKMFKPSQHDKFDDLMKKQLNNIRTKYPRKKIGIVASCFDLLHTGHLIMLEDAKNHCDILIVCLQTNPTIDRPEKNKPIQDFIEREKMVNAIKFIDEIIVYTTEHDYYNILNFIKPDIRILGSDWKGKLYTGYDIQDIPIYFHERTHNWSTTNLRKRIYEAECANK